MNSLTWPAPENFHGTAAQLCGTVSLRVSPEDGMYAGNDTHYLTCGASALNAISAALVLTHIQPQSVLDFGSGAGRVTRWLRAAYPEATIDVTDIRKGDLEFCASEFAARAWLSGTSIDLLEAPSSYDVIWVGSVITHLSGELTVQLIRKLFSWLRPNGVLVLSFHGRFARIRGPQFHYYGLENTWAKVERDYLAGGFGYADYPSQSGYGISLTQLSWAANLVDCADDARLVLLSERAWDNHHDILALQRKSITQAV